MDSRSRGLVSRRVAGPHGIPHPPHRDTISWTHIVPGLWRFVSQCLDIAFDAYGLSSAGRGRVRECVLSFSRRGRTQRSAPTKGKIFFSAQAGKIAASAGVKTLKLTHFRENPENLMRAIEEDVRRDFDGEVIPGRDLLEVEV